jgi:hypothetical protein
MYTGTLIEDLMETVERTERRASEFRSQEEKRAQFYEFAQLELAQLESRLSGVA